MQGTSLKPILTGKDMPNWRKSIYYHYYEFGDPHWVAPHYGIRTERYKLISYYNINEWELFDLEKDPDEMESLCLGGGWRIHPAYKDVADKLVSELKVLRAQFNDTTGLPVNVIPIHD